MVVGTEHGFRVVSSIDQIPQYFTNLPYILTCIVSMGYFHLTKYSLLSEAISLSGVGVGSASKISTLNKLVLILTTYIIM